MALAMHPTPTACASCVFGAYSSQILSFTSSYIEHITVSVTPHITVYTNGSRSTSFESNTLTKSAIVGGIAGSNSSKTFSKKNDITWTVGGATLTYPTKYVQYLGFSGAPAATGDGDTCAERTDASAISLPATTDAASFIYALPANATALPLPTQLLQYLGGLDDLVNQFDGVSLAGCASLDGTPQLESNGSVPYPAPGNDSVSGPSGYLGPSSGIASHSTHLPSGYLGASSGLPSHSLSPSGYVGSSSDSASQYSLRPTGYVAPGSSTSYSPPPLSTGYSGPGTGIESVPVGSVLPVLSGSSSSAVVADTMTNAPSGASASETYPVPSSAITESIAVSSSSPGSTSQFSILPFPYLNTTFSRSLSSSSETISYSAPASTSAVATTSIAVSSEIVSSYSLDISLSTSFTITNPGGIFYPSDLPDPNNAGELPDPETSSTTKPNKPTLGLPPKGNHPEAENPGTDDDGDDEPTEVATTTEAQMTMTSRPPAPMETPSSTDEGENVHTTAFVIEPITGSALITYQSAPTPQPVDEGKTLGDGEYDGGATGAGGNENVAEPTQTPDPDVSTLIGQIGTIAEGEQEGESQDTTSSNPETSDSNPSNSVSTAPGYDDTSDTSSSGQESSGQDSSDVTVGTAGQESSGESSTSNGQGSDSAQDSSGQQQGLDLGQLNSAINSVANQQGDGAAQATPPANADSQVGVSPGSVYSAGNTVVTAQSGGAVVVGDQTVAPGQSVTIGSGPSATVVALETSNGQTDLVIAGSTFQASPGNSAVTAQSNGAVVFEGSTVQSGQSVTIGSGPSATVIALQMDGGSTNLIVGGSTVQVLPGDGTITAPPNAVTGISSMALITTNGQTITAIQSGSSLILQSGSSTTTVAEGEAATFAGETILAVPTEDAVFVNGNITPLTAAEGVEGASQAIITANGHTITAVDAGNSVLLVDGSVTSTLQDGSNIVFQGQTISAQNGGMAVIVNGQTSSLTSAIALATGQAVITADGHTFSVLDLPGYVVLQDGSTSLTIRDGETATFDGQVVTALSNGDAVVVDGQTMSMTEAIPQPTGEAIITAGGHTFTALDMDGYIILQDGTSTLTISDGETGVFDGQTVRALSSGEAVLVNGRTMSLTSVEASATANIDDYINRGLSGGTTSSQTVGAASAEPTNAPDENSASILSTGGIGMVIACFFGLVAML